MLDREQLARDNLAWAEARARHFGPRVGLPADEAASAGLVALAEAIDRYDPARATFRVFCRGLIEKRITDAARSWSWRRRAAPIAGRGLSSDAELMAEVPDVLTTTAACDARVDVARALRELLPVERQVVFLHGKLERTFVETARMLGLPINEVSYLYYRALRKMRATLSTGRPDPADTPARAA